VGGFYSYSFTFDDIPSEEYSLMIYDFGSSKDEGGSFTSAGTVVEDRIARRYKSLYYGSKLDEPLEFNLTFGANTRKVRQDKPLDRWDFEVISSWLTGKDGYRWLTIEQPDLETIRYRCKITDLKYLTVGWRPWVFTCKVICDSPFAYATPETFSYEVNGTLTVPFYNRSTYNGFYKPHMEISRINGDSFSITNLTDNNRVFAFSGLPSSSDLVIDIDNENEIITNTADLNLYKNFNFRFFRFLRGDNTLEMSGNFFVNFTCEFPVNVGG